MDMIQQDHIGIGIGMVVSVKPWTKYGICFANIYYWLCVCTVGWKYIVKHSKKCFKAGTKFNSNVGK